MVPVAMGIAEVANQERIASALVGHCLTGVAYFSLNIGSWQPNWDGPGGDSVDFGVELDFDGHNILSVGWISPTEDTEGLQATQESPAGWGGLNASRLEVGDSSRWLSALGTRVSAVRVDWRPWLPDLSQFFLVGVHLSFAHGQKVTLALAEITPDGKLVRSATNVAVIFEDVTVP